MTKDGTNKGPADLSSDVHPGRGIWWPRAVLHKVIVTLGYSFGQTDIQSDVPPLRHLVAKNGTNIGPVGLSSCSIVCNRPSAVFKSTLQ